MKRHGEPHQLIAQIFMYQVQRTQTDAEEEDGFAELEKANEQQPAVVHAAGSSCRAVRGRSAVLREHRVFRLTAFVSVERPPL